jgi:D-glycero-alpha-D-manno-heptose 1-phosphate guanylyltransferase
MISTAIILAGGLGTRLKGVLKGLPKPMAPINGRPFLECQMDYWINQDISKFILSVGHLSESIIDHFGDSYRNAQISYVDENTPLGTGGALLLASKDVSEPFLLLNGDTFFEIELNDLYSFHIEQCAEWTMSLFRSDDSDRYMGVELAKNGKITVLNSKPSQNDFLVNGGVYLINPSAISKLNLNPGAKFSLEDHLLPSFLSLRGKLFGNEFNAKFIDIGVPKDYYRAHKILKD